MMKLPTSGIARISPSLEATGELLSIAFSDEPGKPVILDLREDEVPSGPSPTKGVPVLKPPRAVEAREAASAIFVRVLGPVVIEGLRTPVTRRRVRELIVFLALHPRGRHGEPDQGSTVAGDEPSNPAFNQTMSRARTALGEASDGMRYVGCVKNSRYRPHPDGPGWQWAYTDGTAYRMAALIEQARQGSDSEARLRL